jgi:hypothetical protein
VNGTFKYIRDPVWKRIQGWLELLLSAAGKEVLIKIVAQAVPTYSMACFRLPRGVYATISTVCFATFGGVPKRARDAHVEFRGKI